MAYWNATIYSDVLHLMVKPDLVFHPFFSQNCLNSYLIFLIVVDCLHAHQKTAYPPLRLHALSWQCILKMLIHMAC